MPAVDPVESDDTLPQRADVVVVGGGIIGVSTAYHLARRGLAVTLCEKGTIGAEQSSRNWGFCRSQNRDPAEIPLMLESLRQWRGLDAELGEDTGFRQSGILYVAKTPQKMAAFERWYELGRQYQLDTRLLTADEAAELLPGSSERWLGALYTPTDGRAEPTKAAPAIARGLRRAGGAVVTHCAVRGYETSGGKVSAVVTERGRIETSALVVAGGAWTSLFLRRHAIRFPQMKVLSSVMRTTPMEEVFAGGLWAPDFAFRRRTDGGYTISDGNSVFDVVPDLLPNFRTFLPAFLHERAGMKIRFGRRFFEELSFPSSWSLDATTPFEKHRVLDPAPYRPALDRAWVKLRQTFPAFEKASIVERWGGLIDTPPDAVPAISAIDGNPGLFIASGFSGHGFGIGPGAGRLMADIVAGDAPCVDPAPFRYSRFVDGSKLVPFIR